MSRTLSSLFLCATLAACGGGDHHDPEGDGAMSSGDGGGTIPDGSTGGGGDGGVVTVKPGSIPPRPVFTACSSGALSLSGASVTSLGTGLKTEHDVVLADFDKDGKVDVAANTVDPDGKISVTVALGKGDGTFGTPKTYLYNSDSPSDSLGLATADFDGDGKYDLVAVGNAHGELYLGVFINKGDGTFADAAIYTDEQETADYLTKEIRVGDLDGDGAIDFVVGSDSGFAAVMNRGDGTFMPPVVYETTSGGVSAIALGDFDGDGKPDVAVDDSNYVAVYLNKGDGTFDTSAPKTVATDNYSSQAFAVGDLDADGKLDLVAWALGPQMKILRGNGDGTLKMPVTYGGDSDNFNLLWGQLFDLDGDQKLDFIATGGPLGEDTLYVGKGDGAGSFGAAQPFDITPDDSSYAPYHFAVHDLNGDGIPDVASLFGATPDSVTVTLGSCK